MSGQVDDVNRFERAEDAVNWMTTFALDACRCVDIFSHALARELFTDAALVDALSQLARRSAASRLRILLRDARPLYGVDHPLINLCRRLPSHTEVRVLLEDIAQPNYALLCADNRDLVYFNDERAVIGFARRNARAEAKSQLESFEHMWQQVSKTDINLRLLAL